LLRAVLVASAVFILPGAGNGGAASAGEGLEKIVPAS